MKISIIIPAYQAEKTIEKCLLSIFDQTSEDFEVIAVNDGSTDKTLDILKKYANKVIIINQENRGAAVARNRGFKESTGEYLFFCDADVVLKPNILGKMLQALENNQEKSFAYSSFKFGFKLFRSFDFDAEKLKKFNYICTMALIRRTHFPCFDESLKRFQDWDLWLTMAEKGYEGIYIPELLITGRRMGGISSMWLPSFLSRFHRLNSSYREAFQVIKKKHNL